MNFKLKSPHSNNESLIIFYSNLKNGQRFVYSTGERISPKLWDSLNQYPIKTKIRIDLLKCNAVKSQLERFIKKLRKMILQMESILKEIWVLETILKKLYPNVDYSKIEKIVNRVYGK